jgi:hypothetical protein
MDIEKLKYPTGKYTPPADISREQIHHWIDTIETFPARLTSLAGHLEDDQLEARYRPGGWTIRQVVHHVVDSHVNSYIRFKWTLTEDRPVIKTYEQTLWAEQPDAKEGPIDMSLEFLSGLHKRWVYMLRGLTDEELNKSFVHPEYNRERDLKYLIGMYAWHCNHHYAHVELAISSPIVEADA